MLRRFDLPPHVARAVPAHNHGMNRRPFSKALRSLAKKSWAWTTSMSAQFCKMHVLIKRLIQACCSVEIKVAHAIHAGNLAQQIKSHLPILWSINIDHLCYNTSVVGVTLKRALWCEI